MKRTIWISCLLLVQALCVTASIIEDNVYLLSGGGFSDFSLQISQDEAGTDTTAALLDINNSELIFQGNLLDEGSLLRFADYGDPVPGTGTEFNNIGQTHDIGYGVFFMTITTWQGSNERTGWVALNNSPTEGLMMVSSAMAYNGESLTVGSIPEPSSVALLVLSGACVYLGRIRTRK